MELSEEQITKSLEDSYSSSDVSADLTGCSLNVEKAEEMARIYAETLEWEKVKEIWHEERIGERGSRGSSQKVFRILKNRFQAGGPYLPKVDSLPSVFDFCENRRDKAQIIYLYLLEKEGLARFITSKLYENHYKSGKIDFGSDNLTRIMDSFRYKNGEGLSYTENTLERLQRGFRTVMRDIEVIQSKQDLKGEPPLIGDVPLQVAAGYSWKKEKKDWVEMPLGGIYLFQPPRQWNDLMNRLEGFDTWELYEVRGKQYMRPENDPFEIQREGK